MAHIKECRNVDKLIRRAKLNEEDRVAAAAKDNPKAFFAHVNSRKPVKNTIGPLTPSLPTPLTKRKQSVGVRTDFQRNDKLL